MPGKSYHIQMEEIVNGLPEGTELLLHSCCGPCSSSVLERLAQRLRVTLLYHNPNIWPEEEYLRRRDEQVALLRALPVPYPVEYAEAPYRLRDFADAAAGLEDEPEGGLRCEACFRLRLNAAAREAADRGIAWFTTTLSVSPHKNAALLNEIGLEAAEAHGVHFLPSDFKKQDGYRRSLALSAEYGLYRQEYCGCEFSYRARQAKQS